MRSNDVAKRTSCEEDEVVTRDVKLYEVDNGDDAAFTSSQHEVLLANISLSS